MAQLGGRSDNPLNMPNSTSSEESAVGRMPKPKDTHLSLPPASFVCQVFHRLVLATHIGHPWHEGGILSNSTNVISFVKVFLPRSRYTYTKKNTFLERNEYISRSSRSKLREPFPPRARVPLSYLLQPKQCHFLSWQEL